VPASAVPAIREAITNAAGIQAKRGDTISIGQVAFAKAPTAAAASGGMMSYAKYALLAIGGGLFLFFTTRALRRRESEAIGEPVWLRELQAPIRLSELEREAGRGPTEVLAAVGSRAVGAGGGEPTEARRQVEQLAESDPDRLAAHVRSWIQED
jgi:flagellar M-ring protein FliF